MVEGGGVLLALWSSKGGSGTSVLAAACALVLARDGGGVRLADLGGDQPAIFGLRSEPETGVNDWLATGVEAPPDAIERLAVAVAPGVVLVPRGARERPLAPVATAEAGAALAVVLRDGGCPTIADAGTATDAAGRAVVEVADRSVLVVRGCYLGLRRAVRSPLTARAAGIALVEEPGRSLGPREVQDVLDLPVLVRVPARSSIARSVDAGVLATRFPEVLGRAAARLLHRVGALADRSGVR
jgi:MinD-like ATPase involved in chromosome partitioning or flagellar assembly